jgi:rod shape determining protein RodA
VKALASKLRQHFDWPLALSVILLSAIGVMNLYSATASTRLNLGRQQLYWLAVGMAVFLLATAIDYRVFNRWAYLLYAIGLVLLSLVLIFGRNVNGAQRWLQIGGVGGQPSEIMKVLMIIALAKYLHDDPVVEGRSLKHMAIPFLVVGLPVVLILRQPDLGTAMIVSLLFLSVMLLIKLKLRSVITLVLVIALSMPLTWSYLLKDYQKQRILTFLDPGADPAGAGWHLRQSLFAIGSGGFFGKGYLKGTQNQLHFLPERWTDFPFAVWAEEWGFAGSALLLGIYLFIILWAVRLASAARDRFGAVLCVGVAALFFWHTVINIGMVAGLLPVVGVTLPLMSYGGSSVITMLAAAGLLMNVSIRRSSY